jgi:hypothetical protein
MTDIARALNDREYFTWWYFDVCCDSGHDLVLIYHVRPFFSHFTIALVDIVVYRNNRKIIHRTIVSPLQACTLAAAPLSLRIGSAGLSSGADAIACRVAAPDIQVQLDVHTGGRQGGPVEALCADDTGAPGFWWQLNAPRASARGCVRCGGETIDIEGIGYHDCNWGSISVPRHIAAWSWGRYMLDREVLVYGTVRDRTGGTRALSVHAGEGGELRTRHALFSHRDTTALFSVPPVTYALEHTSRDVIDEDALYISPLAARYRLVSRCAEYVFYRLKAYRIFRPLCAGMSNVHYTRIKKQFRCGQRSYRHSIHEEMLVRQTGPDAAGRRKTA